MSKFGRNKIALVLACASILSGKASAMNTIKNGVKNPQTLGAVGGASNGSQSNPSTDRQNIRENSLINQNSPKFSTKEKLIATGSIFSALVAGIIGDRIVSNVFSDYSKGKKIAVKFFKNSKFIEFDYRNLNFDKYFDMDDAVDLINPGLKGEKFSRTAIEFNKYYYKFWDDYVNYVATKYFDIGLKHKFIVNDDGQADGFEGLRSITVRVQPGENGKLVIKLFVQKENTPKDITNSFINVFPNNGKAFINDIEKFVNGENFMKQILLGEKNKK